MLGGHAHAAGVTTSMFQTHSQTDDNILFEIHREFYSRQYTLLSENQYKIKANRAFPKCIFFHAECDNLFNTNERYVAIKNWKQTRNCVNNNKLNTGTKTQCWSDDKYWLWHNHCYFNRPPVICHQCLESISQYRDQRNFVNRSALMLGIFDQRKYRLFSWKTIRQLTTNNN